MAALWLLLVGPPARDEVIVGVAAVTAAMAMLWLVSSAHPQNQRFTMQDLATGWRVPMYVVQDLETVLRVLARDLFLCRKPASEFRICEVQPSKGDPRDVARRVLLTAYSSATPNVIVLGVDDAQSLLLLHQLEPAPGNETMRQLGARA